MEGPDDQEKCFYCGKDLKEDGSCSYCAWVEDEIDWERDERGKTL